MSDRPHPHPNPHPNASARRVAIDILFQADVRGEDVDDALADWAGDGREVPDFARELSLGVSAHVGELDQVLGEHAHEWTVHRMAAVDRTIMRLALYELLFRPDVPASAAISEAVVAAKELSTEDSGRFVNGILGRIARELESKAGADAEP
jgi:N utilization substance protein B